MNLIVCPLCKSDNCKPFLSIKFLKNKGKFKIFKCNDCNLLFHYPTYSDDELKNLYYKNYYFFLRDELSEFKRAENMYKRIFSRLNYKNELKILEIGCGRGFLLYLLKQLGYKIKGVEISDYASEYAKEKFGLDVYNGTIEEFVTQTEEHFDLILMIDLIEHIRDPDVFMKSINKISRKNTLLVIDTPNSDSEDLKKYREKWPGFNPFHIRIYNLNSLEILLQKYGFKIIDHFYYGDYRRNLIKEKFREFLLVFNLLTMWDKGRVFVKNKFRKNINRLTSSITDGIKKHNEITPFKGDNNLVVYAVKIQ